MLRLHVIFALLLIGSLHAALKDTAYGIFTLTKVTDSRLTRDSSWQNPNITGVEIRDWWKKIQPDSSTQFNWRYLDKAVALAQEYGKKIGILVVPGLKSPDWIYTEGAQRFTIHGVGVMPCPWDPVFQHYWQQFVQALGTRYDSVDVVSYVTAAGPGRTEECYFCANSADVEELNQDGGVQLWIQAGETIAGFYMQAFPTTPFLYGDGTPTPGDYADYATVVTYCVNTFGASFGIKSDGLYPGYNKNSFGGVEIPLLSPSHPVGFQDLRIFHNAQVLQNALNVGIELKAHFIEVYSKDVYASDDQPVIADAQAQLTGN